MKAKTLKRIGIISFVIVMALVLALTLTTLSSVSTQPTAQAANGNRLKAEYHGSNGKVDKQLTNSDGGVILDRYRAQGVTSELEVVAIDSAEYLYGFLTGANFQDRKVAYLTRDIYLSYNAAKDGYYNVGVNSSNAIFDKILDGNGYTVYVYGGVGRANSNNAIADDAGYRFTRRHGATAYTPFTVEYEYTGFLVAENYGIITNLTVDYTAPHNGIAANAGIDVTGEGNMKYDSFAQSSLQSRVQSCIFVAGVVTGLNGYDGKIDNVKVNINNPFTAIKTAGKDGFFHYNSVYAGGIAGRIENNSTLINSQVDINSTAGIYAGAQGKGNTVVIHTDSNYAMAIAGGIVGHIDSGTAKLHYCAVTGSGQVKAFANRAAKSEHFIAYAGGATGGCTDLYASTSIRNKSVELGQIKGIISSWEGSRFANLHNSTQISMGTLFDYVGSDDVIESVALLFDLEALMDEYASSATKITADGKVVLDTLGEFKNWVAIFPTTDGGTMTAEFDMDHPLYDIRVHIVADGHDDLKNSGEMDLIKFEKNSRFYQYKLKQGDGGGIIWSGTFKSANDSSNHINLQLDDPIYAEIYMISSTNSGNYNYEFGTMGILDFDKTSDVNDPNLNYVRAYEGAGNPLKLPTLIMTNNLGFDTSLFKNESYWNISRDNSDGIALSQTYMPGTYRMNVKTSLGERTYGYYNEEQRILAWQMSQDYIFTILRGELKFGDGTTATDGWQKSVTFELKMNKIGDFDSILFQRGGTFPENFSAIKPNASGVARYTVTEGTGKNGATYTFYAYKRDTVSETDVVVAVSESRTVRIDTEAPEISEIQYYMVENGQERLLSEDDIDEIQEKWTKNQVLAKFSVTDNEKSGIATAETQPYIHDTVLNSYGDRDVVVEINDSTPKRLTYVDGMGLPSYVDLQLNVDRVEGKLIFSGDSYRLDGFNYSTKSVTLRYRADCGDSGWRLHYSYQRDAQGNDIWVACPDLLPSNSPNMVRTLTIDWNMGNVSAGEGDDFKIKMVNEAGLYDEIYPLRSNGKPYPNNVVSNYIIWLRIANIYLDNSFNNIYVEGENKCVADILQDADEKAKYFNKEYDGTDGYEGKKEYKFYADLSKLNENGFYSNDKLGVIYSPAGMSRPKINVGVNGIVPVSLKYSTSEAGDAEIYFQIELQGINSYNYIIYFTKLSDIDFNTATEVAEGAYSSTCGFTAKIEQRTVEIKLEEHDAFNGSKQYYFGDEIPKMVDVLVESTGEVVEIQINTDASSKANKGIYAVDGIAPQVSKNIKYIVISTTLEIKPKHIAIDLRYDNGDIGNIPTGVQAGKTHRITGTYQDVNGETQNAVIKYEIQVEGSSESKVVEFLGEVGDYTVTMSVSDGNYVIDGQTSFKFKISKGFLEIGTGLRTKDYTEGEIEYDVSVDGSEGLYEKSDIKLTYYEYLEGAVYNAAEGKIEGKLSDTPMTSKPVERGYYCVKVEFAPESIKNFFPKSDYADGYLVIVSADTQVNVEKVTLEYYYTADMFTFDLEAAVAEVRSSSNKQLWSTTGSSAGSVKVQYKDATGKFVDVAENPKDGGGWYSETGRYEYRINYVGTENYNNSTIDVVMIINEAELKGITFNSIDTVYDGNLHLPTAGGLLGYPGLKVVFQHKVNQVHCDAESANEAIKEFDIKSAGEYTIYMTVSKEGYATKQLTATVNIKKAVMEGISAKVLDVVYDQSRHTVEFVGLETNGNSYSYKGEKVIISAGNSEGNLFATDVFMEPEVGPSYYTGEVTFSSPNYEDKKVNTQIIIRQALLSYKEVGIDLPNQLPSAINLSQYKGYFIGESDEKIVCELQYRDKDDNIVALDENGTLADGKYKVMLVIENSNYYLNRYWEFNIGEINDPSISTFGIVAIAAVGVLLAGAAITAIIVVKKRKKAGIV